MWKYMSKCLPRNIVHFYWTLNMPDRVSASLLEANAYGITFGKSRIASNILGIWQSMQRFRIQCGAILTQSILPTNIHKRHPTARPLGRDMGCLFVDLTSDWYSASVPVIINEISYKIGLHFNGLQLYISLFSKTIQCTNDRHCYLAKVKVIHYDYTVFNKYWYCSR